MKPRLKVYGFIVLALVIVAGVMNYASNELSALVWHMRHGFHTEIGGIRLRIPLAYEADDPHGLPSLLISKLPGHLSGPGGFIMIDFQRLPSPEAMESAEALLRQKGVSLKPEVHKVRLGERPATFAGKQGKCVEYSAAVVELRLHGADIDCRFDGDVSVHLIGSSNLRDDFYSIIQTAESVARKN